jgi:hypothetical protein
MLVGIDNLDDRFDKNFLFVKEDGDFRRNVKVGPVLSFIG